MLYLGFFFNDGEIKEMKGWKEKKKKKQLQRNKGRLSPIKKNTQSLFRGVPAKAMYIAMD